MTEENSFSFEQAYQRLEQILEKMNSGKTPLEESIKLYEEADRLISSCNARLSDAEQKIETLIKTREGELSLSTQQKPLTQAFS